MSRRSGTSMNTEKAVDCSHKRRREWKNSRIPYLHEEIIFNILVLLPAEILHNSMRYVCRQWYNIITDPVFINAHLLRSNANAGLYIQSIHHPFSAQFVEMGKGNFMATNVNYQFPGTIMDSRDGLLLFRDERNYQILHVANPVTKNRVTLPPLTLSKRITCFSCGLAFVPSTEEYKVVLTYKDENYIRHCQIVTVGTDNAWRLIDIKHILGTVRRTLDFIPFSGGGFFHWAFCFSPCVLTLDVDAETVRQIPAPKDCDFKIYFYVQMGESLSFVTSSLGKLVSEIWVLSDIERGVWKKLYKINLKCDRLIMDREIFYLTPIACLNNGQLLIFSFAGTSGPFIAYDVKKEETSIVQMEVDMKRHFKYVHVNSLVLWKTQ